MSASNLFEADARAFIEAHAPASLRGTRQGAFDGYWGGKKAKDVTADQLAWRDAMHSRGWTAPTWPEAYGGGGCSLEESQILEALLEEFELPPPVAGFGLAMLGPVLLRFGDEAQKQAHLPGIVRGDIRWCQGYSEPGSGSDLASLQTRAERRGDSFIINGQKIWTSHADKSDWIFCLVRTSYEGKKQAGISFLLIDMDQPGVTVRPIVLISGSSPFCEVFFEDVTVPVANVIGGIDRGWTVAKALLGQERTMIGKAMGGQLATAESELVALARRHLAEPESGQLIDDAIRQAIAANAMDEACFGLTMERIMEVMETGGLPGSESSILKLCGSEFKQNRWSLGVEIAGPEALGWEPDGFAPEDVEMTRQWLRSRGNTIEGGTSEIQLNIIAKRVLGLGT